MPSIFFDLVSNEDCYPSWLILQAQFWLQKHDNTISRDSSNNKWRTKETIKWFQLVRVNQCIIDCSVIHISNTNVCLICDLIRKTHKMYNSNYLVQDMNTKLSHDVDVIISTMTQIGMVPASHVDKSSRPHYISCYFKSWIPCWITKGNVAKCL